MRELEIEQQREVERKKQKQNIINEEIIKANRNAILVAEQRKLKEK